MRRFSLAAMGGSTAVPSTVFLINEDCEGTGIPGGWTFLVGTTNWDYTTIPLEGAQSLYMTTLSTASRVRVDWTDQTEIWVYFMFRGTNGTMAPTSTVNVMQLVGNGGVGTAINLILNTAAKFRVGTATVPANALAIDTTYHVWWHYLKGTGANATQDIGFSTDGVRPTSGGNFAQVTTDAGTTNAGRLVLGSNGTVSQCDWIYDKIRVAATQIGDNGT